MTKEDEKNLAAFKKLTGETSDGSCLKIALSEYPKLKKQLQDLQASSQKNDHLLDEITQNFAEYENAKGDLDKSLAKIRKR